MPEGGPEINVAGRDVKRVGNVQHGQDPAAGHLVGVALIPGRQAVSLLVGITEIDVRRPVMHPLPDAGLGIFPERAGADLVAGLVVLQAEVELVALLAPLHLQALAEQQVIAARGGGIVVVGAAVLVEGGLAAAALLPHRGELGRETPVLSEGLQVAQGAGNHAPAAGVVVMQVARGDVRPVAGLRAFQAGALVLGEIVIEGQGHAAPFLADVLDTAGDAAVGPETARIGGLERVRAVEFRPLRVRRGGAVMGGRTAAAETERGSEHEVVFLRILLLHLEVDVHPVVAAAAVRESVREQRALAHQRRLAFGALSGDLVGEVVADAGGGLHALDAVGVEVGSGHRGGLEPSEHGDQVRRVDLILAAADENGRAASGFRSILAIGEQGELVLLIVAT